MAHILLVATADTKGQELAYLAQVLRAEGADVLTIDVGTRPQRAVAVDVAAQEVAAHHPRGADAVFGAQDRGQAVAAMGQAFAVYLSRMAPATIAGILGVGGGGGTSIVTSGMRTLPIGIPKFMVSTLASGDTSGFVDISDIIMMPAITDLSGLNRISRRILHNAAHAMLGMRTMAPLQEGTRPAVGLTMFGVTTQCVTQLQGALDRDFECMVFHATGAGGRTMEKLIDERVLHGVLDVTTTEVCDLLFGGVLPAGSGRFESIVRSGIPCVASLGATDMVNFWAPQTVPQKHAGRLFHAHNPNVTLMRTTADEMRQVGAWIGARLAQATGPMLMLIPEKGVSALDIEGGPFFDPEADAALFAEVTETICSANNPHCRVERVPLHINSPEFTELAAQRFRDLMASEPKASPAHSAF